MNASEAVVPGLWQGFAATVRRDLVLGRRRPGDVLTPLMFFAIVSTLFPLAIGPDSDTLRVIGPGVSWVAALLAVLLGLNGLFRDDFDDGSLEQLLLSPQPLPLLVLAKVAAHWLLTGLPLVVMSPLIAMSFGLPGDAQVALAVTLLPGTLSLSLVGATAAALTIGLARGSALLGLLVLPLAMPVLIFGARGASLAAAGDGLAGGAYFLWAYCVLAATLAPFATAAALRISNE